MLKKDERNIKLNKISYTRLVDHPLCKENLENTKKINCGLENLHLASREYFMRCCEGWIKLQNIRKYSEKLRLALSPPLVVVSFAYDIRLRVGRPWEPCSSTLQTYTLHIHIQFNNRFQRWTPEPTKLLRTRRGTAAPTPPCSDPVIKGWRISMNRFREQTSCDPTRSLWFRRRLRWFFKIYFRPYDQKCRNLVFSCKKQLFIITFLVGGLREAK